MKLSAQTIVGICVYLAIAVISHGAPARQDRQAASLRRQQQKVERMERQISDERRKLDTLRRAMSTLHSSDMIGCIPVVTPKVATIIWTTSAHQGTMVGRKDGFRDSDRLVVLRRTKAGLTVQGYCVIEQLYATDMVLVCSDNSIGIRPLDEVYIANREDSPYSLASANFSAGPP